MSSETATHHGNATYHHGKHHKTPHNKKSPRKNVDLSLSGYRDSKGEALEPIPIIISAGHEPEQ